MKLTNRQLAALRSVARGAKHFGALTTSRATRLSDVRELAKRGLVYSVGPVALCDGDGSIVQPKRYRKAWAPTTAGIRLLAEADNTSTKPE